MHQLGNLSSESWPISNKMVLVKFNQFRNLDVSPHNREVEEDLKQHLYFYIFAVKAISSLPRHVYRMFILQKYFSYVLNYNLYVFCNKYLNLIALSIQRRPDYFEHRIKNNFSCKSACFLPSFCDISKVNSI